MSVNDCYRNKRVLITGTTGFLGKVLLEKFLFSLSSVDKIFVLIRAKEGSNLYERFKKEIISSQCFERCRNVHKSKFDEFITNKVVPMYLLLHTARATCSETAWACPLKTTRCSCRPAISSSTARPASTSTPDSTTPLTAISEAPSGCSSWPRGARSWRCSPTYRPATSTATKQDSSRRRSTRDVLHPSPRIAPRGTAEGA